MHGQHVASHRCELSEFVAASARQPRLLQQRVNAFDNLLGVVQAWVADALDAAVDKTAAGSTDCARPNAAVRLVKYGSSSLPGLSQLIPDPGTDLDILCIVPHPVSRDKDFFGEDSGLSLAARLAANPNIVEVVPVPVAFVPCIKLVCCGVPVDLTFCALPMAWLQDPAFRPEQPTPALLAAAAKDPPAARSLSAVHANTIVHEAIGDANAGSFGILYTAVRLWASRRGIHGKQLGYPGGFSWAVLCTVVCQQHPGAPPDELLTRFFRKYASWEWPQPVQMIQSDEKTGQNSVGGWDPDSNPSDATHLMPILTPMTGGARINSTHCVTRATHQLISREFARAATQPQGQLSAAWLANLFKPTDFFTEYRHFVCLELCCTDAVDKLNARRIRSRDARWFALCESLLRVWIPKLESALELPNCSLYPFPRRLNQPPMPGGHRRNCYVFGFNDQASDRSSMRLRQESICRASAEFRQNALDRARGGTDLARSSTLPGGGWIIDEMFIEIHVHAALSLPPWIGAEGGVSLLQESTNKPGITSAQALSKNNEVLKVQLDTEQRRMVDLEHQLLQAVNSAERFQQEAATARAELNRIRDLDHSIGKPCCSCANHKKVVERLQKQNDRAQEEMNSVRKELCEARAATKVFKEKFDKCEKVSKKQKQDIKQLQRQLSLDANVRPDQRVSMQPQPAVQQCAASGIGRTRKRRVSGNAAKKAASGTRHGHERADSDSSTDTTGTGGSEMLTIPAEPGATLASVVEGQSRLMALRQRRGNGSSLAVHPVRRIACLSSCQPTETAQAFRIVLYLGTLVMAFCAACIVHQLITHGAASRFLSILAQQPRQARTVDTSLYAGHRALDGAFGTDPVLSAAILILFGIAVCVWILRSRSSILASEDTGPAPTGTKPTKSFDVDGDI